MAATLSVVVLVSLAIAGCSGNATEEEAADTTVQTQSTSIVIAIADEPSTLDPQATEDGNERAVTDNIYETLLRRDSATNELIPWLATEMPTMVSDTKWQFKLREGVTFSNGDPFNAESAAFSINRVMNKEYNSGQIDFYGGIVDAVAVDALTVEVNLAAADPVFPARMYRLKMLNPKTTDASIIEKAVGTGPYVLGAWNRGQDITLSVNPTYWGVKPVITDVKIKFIPEANTRVAGLQSGEIQLATLLPPEQAKDAPQVITRDGIEFPVYRLKNYEGVTKDPRIRQALNYAVDKEALANDLFSGYASVAQCQPLTPSHFGFNANLKPYPYDPEKAKALLEEAGYKGEEVSLLGATGRWLKDAEMTSKLISDLSPHILANSF
jgi:peptide/nickel transport system substrate-binding protein